MFKVPSKYETSHYTSFSAWLRKQLTSAWHIAPSAFVNPYVSKMRFLFVCGCGHSGTTLVAAKIGQHPNAFLIGRETNAFAPARGLQGPKQVVSEWDYFAQVAQKELVIEKTPKHVHSVNRILKILPEAKIVITVRNPLDNIASLYARFNNLEGSIRRWTSDNSAALELVNKSATKIVKYEDLTAEPQEEFKALASFAGLSWTPEILNSGETGYEAIAQQGNMAIRAEQVRQPIRPNIGGWKKILSEKQANQVARRTQRLAAALGYPTVFDPLREHSTD